MNTPHHPDAQIRPDLSRFTELRERCADILAPVETVVPGLGRSAQVACRIDRHDRILVRYVGVSERGQALDRSFDMVPAARGATALVAGEDGTGWHVPGLEYGGRAFHDPDEPDCEVGPSEDGRIVSAILDAAISYVEGNPDAVLAARALREVRLAAMKEAEVRALEARLAAERSGATALRARADEMADRLEAALSPAPKP